MDWPYLFGIVYGSVGLSSFFMSMYGRSYANLKGKEIMLFAYMLIAPVGLLSALCEMFSPQLDSLRQLRSDHKNPLQDNIRDVIRQINAHRAIPGKDSKKEQEEFVKLLIELRGWPKKQRRLDAERHLAALQSESKTVKELSRARLKEYERIQRDTT